MNAFLLRALIALTLALALAAPAARATPDEIGVGTKLDELTVGPTTYRKVVVRSLNARTVVVLHSGGMASIRLRDLAPELQAKFHYDPAKEARADEQARTQAAALPKPVATPKREAKVSAVERVLQQFGQPAVIREEVNLRPKFIELGIGVRNQGRRPSCSIFAIVSALEYQDALLVGQTRNYSEDYLIWATQKLVRQPAEDAPDANSLSDDADAGFTLTEVVNALRSYGIPLQEELSNNYERGIRGLAEPSPEVIREAQANQRVYVHQVPGRDTATRINNIIHALNAGLPVPVGMAWPNYRALRTGYLSEQKPMENSGHAVTLVGYHAKGGRIEDGYFVFKNSWGKNWGQEGYGTVTYSYLNKYLADAVLLEVQRG